MADNGIKKTTLENKKFDLIHDFQYRQAKKLHNSSYLEDLTGLLAEVATIMDDDKNYFFGSDFYFDFDDEEFGPNKSEKSKNEKPKSGEPNTNFLQFIHDFKNTVKNGSSDKINIIRGKAGIGKNTFFANGIKRIVDRKDQYDDEYIYMGADFKNIDNDKDIEYYEQWIHRKLCTNAKNAIMQLRGGRCI